MGEKSGNAKVTSAKLLTAVEDIMIEKFELPENHIDIGIFTTNCDEAGYVALDEATKKSNVTGDFARSTYGGKGTANGGEFFGVISGPSIDDVESGLRYIIDFVNTKAGLYKANDDGSVTYFSQCVSRIGSYFAKRLNLPEGSSIAYVSAPPLEGMVGVDEALTSADVEVVEFFSPPTVSNRSGAILTGTQSACETACKAFAKAVEDCVEDPLGF
ncbi:MAG: ethanolamine utilization microcompartment protein EutL [Eubacteriaceae bacterium]